MTIIADHCSRADLVMSTSRTPRRRPRRGDGIYGFEDHLRRSIQLGRCLPLLPRHEVYLWLPEGGGQRFAALFRTTWQRLPLGVRRCVLKHWKRIPLVPGAVLRPEMVHPVSPRIDLSLIDPALEEWEDDPSNFAQVGNLGHRLWFRSSDVAMMPDNVVQDLIAHQLAHVVQCANGMRCIHETESGIRTYAYPGDKGFDEAIKAMYGLDQSESESQPYVLPDDVGFGPEWMKMMADELVVGWGFEVDSIDEWALQVGRVDQSDLPTMSAKYEKYGR